MQLIYFLLIAFGFVCGYGVRKFTEKKRKAAEISIKCDVKDGKFTFTAKSTSESRIWIKSITISNYPESTHKVQIFGGTIFEYNQEKFDELPITSEMKGEYLITDIDARIQMNSEWMQCFTLIRSDEAGVITIQFVPPVESLLK